MSEEKKEKVENAVEKQRRTARKTNEKKTVIYMGPSIRHVAASGTIYNNGLPEVLEVFIAEHPVFGKLIVPVENITEAQKELTKSQSTLSVCFTEAQKVLNKKEEE